MTTLSSTQKNDISANRIWAAMSYVLLLSLVLLLTKRDSAFVQFHARQGVVLFLFWLLMWVDAIGFFVFWIWLVLTIICIVQALRGEYFSIPLVSRITRFINL